MKVQTENYDLPVSFYLEQCGKPPIDDLLSTNTFYGEYNPRFDRMDVSVSRLTSIYKDAKKIIIKKVYGCKGGLYVDFKFDSITPESRYIRHSDRHVLVPRILWNEPPQLITFDLLYLDSKERMPVETQGE